VRLGAHADGFVFEVAKGLHDPVMGLAVVGGSMRDPDVMWEEHGLGEPCRYLKVHRNATLNEDLGPAEGRPDIATRLESDDERVRFSGILAAFSLERADHVNSMLERLRTTAGLPEGGHAWVIQQTARFQHRMAMMRILHAAQAQPDRTFETRLGEPEPIGRHSAGGGVTVEQMYYPLVLLSSPFTTGIVGERIVKHAGEAYLLVVLFGDDCGFLLRDADVLWSDLYELWPMWRDPTLASRQWLKDVTAPAARLPAPELLEWWTCGLNQILTEMTDLGRYSDASGVFHARTAYRALRTLDRMFMTCTRIQTRPDDHVGRVGSAFQYLDLIPAILGERVGARDVYETLLNPSRVRGILIEAFRDTPPTIGEHLRARAEAICSHLRDETLDTVVPGRRVADGVLVGDERDTAVPPDVYVARLFHQLRNTHHGYALDRQWKRDLLDSHTGHIAYGFPELVVLLTIAMVADAEAALSGTWFTG
jgi:hypothetical protein